MKSQREVRADFDAYLRGRFGFEIADLVTPPAGVQVGERVLYQLATNKKAVRPDIKQVNREIREDMVALVSDVDDVIDGVTFYFEPVVDSGLPYARTVDLPYASDLTLGSLADEYAASSDEFPLSNFPVCWLFGVVFSYSAKYILYLDFTHPKLRALFVAEYDSEFGSSTDQNLPESLRSFIGWQRDMQAEAMSRQDVLWIKLVQTDAGKSVKTGAQPNSDSVTDEGDQ